MSDPKRNVGLDWIRIIGLLMMVVMHFVMHLPQPGPHSRVFQAIGHTGAAFFFFAFGMTSPRASAKPLEYKVESLLLFLYVGLAHNLYIWRKITSADFLFVLFLWRVILIAVQAASERPLRVQAWMFAGMLAILLGVRDSAWVNQVFTTSVTGYFALGPWGLFILGGSLYAGSKPRRALALGIGLACIAVSLALYQLAVPLDRPALLIQKWPSLRGPYVLLMSGICIVVVEAVNAAGAAATKIPVVSRGIRALSDHLLTGTAIHYTGVLIVVWIARRWTALQMDASDDASVMSAIWVASACLLAIFFVSLPAALALWRRVVHTRLLVALRARSELTAVALLTVTALVSSKAAKGWMEAHDLAAFPAYLSLLVLIYFAFELAEWQRASRSKRQAVLELAR